MHAFARGLLVLDRAHDKGGKASQSLRMSQRVPLLNKSVNTYDGDCNKNEKPLPDHSSSRGKTTIQHLKESYTIKSLFTVKPIQAFLESREAKPEGGSLAQKLGLIDLLGYGIGCTVGAGIYSLIGVGAGIAGICVTV